MTQINHLLLQFKMFTGYDSTTVPLKLNVALACK